MILKITGNSDNLDTANTGNNFYSSTCIRVRHDSDVVVTLFDSNGNQTGNTTLYANTEYFIQKRNSDLIACSNATVMATPVGITTA